MSCGCILVDGDGSYETLSNKKPKARKEHCCNECNRTIKPGETYESYYGVLSKETLAWKTCADCLSVRDEFFCEGFCFGMIWEDVAEHVNEMSGEISSECLARLTPKAREGVIELIDDVFVEVDMEEDRENASQILPPEEKKA